MYNCNCINIFYIKEPVGTCLADFVNLGFNATLAGEYQLKLSFLNSEVTIKREFEIGDALTFPTTGLNENYEWVGNVINPDGEHERPVGTNGIVYDCFSFKTTIKINL